MRGARNAFENLRERLRTDRLRRFRGAFAAIPLALAVGACAVGPDYMPPLVAVPSKWSSADRLQPAAAPVLARWWMRLNDPLLNALIDEAVLDNRDVAIARARVREARASYRQTAGALFPTVRGTSSVTDQKSGPNLASEGVPASIPAFSQDQAGFDASWEIDIFGKYQRGAEVAGYGVEAADEQLRVTLLTLIGDVASNYAMARGYQARLALARRTAAAQRETTELTGTRFEAGGASAIDLANAKGQMSTTEAAIPGLEASYAGIVHRLSVLIGQAPGSLMKLMSRNIPIPRPRLPMPIGIPADILMSRPDIQQAERVLAQATARIGQAEAARYPTISLTGNISTTGLKVGDLAKNSSIGWSVGPTLSAPIFNGGQLQAAVEFGQAQRDQSFTQYQAAVLKGLEEVENAIVALAQERIRLGKLSVSVESYRQAATLSRALYRNGSTSFFTVLDAERSLYSAEDALVQSRIALATDYIALNKALGGGWDSVVDVSKPEVVDTSMGPRPRSAILGRFIQATEIP
ncbi:multidrug efflux system outer membrane protein [Bradyrhizobium sp. LA6.1]|uniref:efflux transporter outer membrane subunit n=1 Tax=Bradyrhizobium sp. LA6.1 TaxID=3156378 RepID=UPI003391A4A1